MSMINQLKESLTPRAILGLGVLVLIGVFLIIDWGTRYTEDLELGNIALKQKVAELESLETEDNLERLTVQADDLWQAYRALLLQDETEGLNIAGLQSSVIATLSDCGLERVVANVDTGPTQADPAWSEYVVTVRARDSENSFPLCLNALSQLDVGIVVSDITWRRQGSLQFVLNAYSAVQSDSPGQINP